MDIEEIKEDFPILKRRINGKPIVYLDSTATSLKPTSVIKAVNDYYQKYTSNVFRGVYRLSEEATKRYEDTRKKIALFINAKNSQEIVFVRNATEAINLVAYGWGRLNINENDEIVTTIMEHHSNFVPWQQLAVENGALFKIIGIDKNGYLQFNGLNNQKTSRIQNKRKRNMYGLEKIITERTKFVAITHVSNVLGTINPIKSIIHSIKHINSSCKVLVDGAQSIPHMPVDVQELGCDFYVFSGHKMLGPTGIGVLWAKQSILEEMVPFNFGGDMIREVHLNYTTYKKPPYKFEAGTPHIAGVIGLNTAVDYLSSIGMGEIHRHETNLVEYALCELKKLDYVTVYGPHDPDCKSGVVAFNVYDKDGKLIHGHDVAQVLDEDNIYIRSGHHCAMPLHDYLNLTATSRASFYIYNTHKDVDALIKGLKKVVAIFSN